MNDPGSDTGREAEVNPAFQAETSVTDRSTRALQDAAKALEWPRFLRLASEFARSETGRKLLEDLADPRHWAGSVEAARHLQREAREILDILEREALWGPLNGLGDPEPMLETLDRGGLLDLSELVEIRRWLYAIDSWAQMPRDLGPLLEKAGTAMMDPRAAIRTISRVVTETGELSEDASPRLASLHSEVRSIRREISRVMESLVRRYSEQGLLQEAFSDVMDGRYVLPVKISEQGKIGGLVSGSSSSRQTVYVEPPEVNALNNRLRERESELQREIYIILTKVSNELREDAADIRSSASILAHWDAVQAKARFAHQYGGIGITVPDGQELLMLDTAHPLLWWSVENPDEEVIRNDLELEAGQGVLLITGPNTGGKTVLLKTVGLAAICARTGFMFPAAHKAVVPFFDSIFVDVGDPQSIEAHLSSFSGHILRFKQILEGVTPRSLVLIDELNTATDPEEGAALSRAFLEQVMESGRDGGELPVVIATTHDPHLKALSATDDRFLNTSMEFDEETMEPTYRLVHGVPGLSRALETAERLGLPAPVLEKARSYLSVEHREFEKLLNSLSENVQKTWTARREAELMRDEVERLKRQWIEKTGAEAEALLTQTRERLRRITVQAQEEIRSAVKKAGTVSGGGKGLQRLDEIRGSVAGAYEKALSETSDTLKDEAPELEQQIRARSETAVQDKPELSPGTIVRVSKWKSFGEVVEIMGSKVRVSLTSPGGRLGSGAMTMTVAPEDLELLSEGEAKKLGLRKRPEKTRSSASVSVQSDVDSISAELDVRGARYEDGLAEIERYLDRAYRSGLREVTIIHGVGTGALREGARKFLREVSYVKQFQDGGIGRGGTGATVVEFER